MFENTSDCVFDEDLLGTSFAPVFSSTQENVKQPDSHIFQDFIIKSKTESENGRSGKTEIRIDASQAVKERLQRSGSLLKDNSNVTLDVPQPVLKHSQLEHLKNSNSTFSSPPKVLKRKFPGPAGLLPDKNYTKSFSEPNQKESIEDVFLCSQRTLKSFEDGPWNEMIKDFGATGSGALYERFNINWIKRNCSAKKLLKAPFLAAVIQSVEIIHGNMATINILLKDTTGDIEGSILNSLYGEKSQLFTSGSVIVLKDFGVLTVRNNHCLTITPNSLLVIYHLEKDIDGNPVSVKKNVMQKFNLRDIWRQTQENVDLPNLTKSCTSKFQLDVIQQNSMNPSGSREFSLSNKLEESRTKVDIKNNAASSENGSLKRANCKDNVTVFSQVIHHSQEQANALTDLFESIDPESLFDEF